MDKNESEKRRLVEANLIVIFGRWFYVATIAATGLVSRSLGGPNANFSPTVMVLMFSASYGINFAYWWYFKHYSKKTLLSMRIFSFLSLMMDTVLITLAIYFAGGIISISFLYYFYALIASAFIYSIWGVMIIATIDSIAYAGLLLAIYYNIIPFLPRYNIAFETQLAFDKVAIATNLFAVISSFYVAGFFCGLIARMLRKKENEILQEKDRQEAILSNLSDGLIYISNQGKIDMINPKAEKMLGVSASKIVGRNIDDVSLDKLDIFLTIIKSNVLMQEYNSANLKDTYLRVFSVEVKSKEGKLIGTIKVLHDISREKYIDKMKTEFITIASHQLRTPLSAIKGGLSLFLSGDYGKVTREQEITIKQSYEYTERLIKIVNDMLNANSAEEGKFAYGYEKVSIKDFVERNTGRYVEEAKAKKINITFNFEENLPLVEIDQNKFKLVLNTLVENALIYNNAGGSVGVNFDNSDGKLLMSVADTGIGIPKEIEEKIFTKFFRAENALHFYTEGNGLDLYVAKNIVENHQGDIWFESQPGKGTTFYVKIPFEQTKKGEAVNKTK